MNSTRSPRVLVVEDEGLIAEEIHDRLERLGYRVTGRADTGEGAIRAVAEARPDLVLMDIRLKGAMDGIAAADHIRQRLDVPIVYLTAHSDQATLRRARESAPFGYVLKPFQERDLLVAIEMALQRHRVEQRLRESEARYATTLASIQDGVVATDLGGLVTFMNPAAERLTGWPLSDARGRHAREVVVLRREPDGGLPSHPIEETLARSASLSVAEPMLLVERGGSTIPFEDSAAPIVDVKGRVGGAVMVFRDGGQRRVVERAEAFARVAGGLAHDLGNLVTAILCNGSLLEKGVASSAQAPRVGEIRRAGERAADLTRKLLACCRQLVVEPQVVDLNELVSGIEGLVRPLLGKGVELLLRPWPGTLPVRVDCGQMEQVLLNLALNARDAMPEGGQLTIQVQHEAGVEGPGAPHESAPGGWAVLSVDDTGEGMDATVQAHAFEPFFTTKPAGRGHGLGLASVQAIVHQSGGRIAVDSTPGKGTSFRIHLPVVSGEVPQRAARASRKSPPRGSETILLIDDQDFLLAVMALALEELGYRVLRARSIAEATELLRQNASKVRLVVCDLPPSTASGKELAAQLTALAPGLRVLFVTGRPPEDATALAGPRTAFLQKPFDSRDLSERVRELLDRTLAAV